MAAAASGGTYGEEDNVVDMDSVSKEDIPALLRLAAEHDRVDILQDLIRRTPEVDYLNNSNSGSTGGTTSDADKAAATTTGGGDGCTTFVPPLHVAISSGSVHAATCLLRMGADPSIRPSTTSTTDHNHNHTGDKKYDGWSAYELLRHCNLPVGKKKGIEHAFFAEALRAIGSEDVARLECLLRSGLEVENDNDNDDKNLLDWARDITESRDVGGCFHLLQHWGDDDQDAAVVVGEEPRPDDLAAATKKDTEESRTNPSAAVVVVDTPTKPTTTTTSTSSLQNDFRTNRIQTLEIKIEESQALEDSLAPILDEIMEETKICHGLLHGSSSSSSSSSGTTLVNHVKKMKAIKAQKEVELEQYQQLLKKAYNDMDRLKYAYYHQSRIIAITNNNNQRDDHHDTTKNVAPENETPTAAAATAAHPPPEPTPHPPQVINGGVVVVDANLLERLTSQLNESESKVKTLRSALMEMAQENEEVMRKVEEKGLAGAVRLARSLRQELLQLNQRVTLAHEEEEDCHAQMRDLRKKLRRLENKDEEEEDAHHSQEESEPEKEDDDEDSACDEYESGSEYTSSSVEDEEYTDEEYDEEEDDDEDEMLPSAAISRGKSSAIVSRKSTRFPLDIWDLLCRIVGLGKTAVKETKDKTKVQLGRHTSGIMIV